MKTLLILAIVLFGYRYLKARKKRDKALKAIRDAWKEREQDA